MTDTEEADVVVIGSGMGGLAAARAIAQFGGRRVLVLEQHHTIGGIHDDLHGGLSMTTTRRTLLAGSAAATAGAMLNVSPAQAGTAARLAKPTVVLVHGAFADASGWNGVAARLLCEDQVLPVATQRFMAQRAGARLREIDASHVAMISQPAATTDLIERAAR